MQLTAIGTDAAGQEEVDLSSRFLIYQNRCGYEQYFFVGDRMDRMRRTADGEEDLVFCEDIEGLADAQSA